MRISCGEKGIDAPPAAFRSPQAAENQFRAPACGVDGASSSEIREFR
jgi:hypothetical protein